MYFGTVLILHNAAIATWGLKITGEPVIPPIVPKLDTVNVPSDKSSFVSVPFLVF